MSKRRTVIGFVVSAAYLAGAGYLCWLGQAKFSEMKPNEFGDLLAGIAGPLALFWLIIGYLQQGEELHQSSLALAQQAEELRRSVEQQQALVEVSRKQVEAQTAALEHERHMLKAARAPLFALRSNGDGVIAEREKTYPLVLRNFGADVNRVQITYEGGGHRRAGFSIDLLRRGEAYEFEVTDLRARDNLATIRISYVDGGGESGEWTYTLTFHFSRMNQGTTLRIDQVQA